MSAPVSSISFEEVPSQPCSRTQTHTLDRFDLIVLVLFALSVFAVAKLPVAPKKFGDGDFDLGARNIAAALKHEGTWSSIRVYRLPGAIAYYTIPYLFVPVSAAPESFWLAGVSWNMLWLAVMTLLLRRAGEQLAGPLAGQIAAVASLLSPFAIYYAFSITAETPAYIGAVLTAYGSLRWLRLRPQAWFTRELGITVAGLSLMMLSRTNIVLLLPIMLIGALVAIRTDGIASFRFAFLCSAATGLVMLAVTALILALPSAKPQAQTDNLIFVAYQGRFQFRTQPWDWRFWQDYPGRTDYEDYWSSLQNLRAESQKTGVSLSTLQLKWIVDDFRHHPINTLKMSAIRVLSIDTEIAASRSPHEFVLGPLQGPLAFWLFHIVVNAVNYLALALSAGFIYIYRDRVSAYWLWGPWIAIVVFHAMVYAEPRYLLPARPGLLLMSSAVVACYFTVNSRSYLQRAAS
ncbi:MAG TPA: hypothetical protein VEI49_07025 [Terriglobales bacterium]|nr:hypothetical protein [Terriglobales bacterium]